MEWSDVPFDQVPRMNVLYRAFDADDVLLYVGATTDFRERMNGHKNSGSVSHAEWWDAATRITVELFMTKEQLFAAEKRAIMEERPCCNWIPGEPMMPVGIGLEDRAQIVLERRKAVLAARSSN